MDTDLALIFGLVIAAFGIVSLSSAISDRRSLRATVLTVLIAGGLVAYAVTTKPGGYRIEQVPDVFYSVIGRFF